MTVAVSWLREARLAADITSDAALARAISVRGATVDQWGRNSRTPSWRWIEPLADALRLSPSEVVVGLWEETPGEACECGCGGEKVFPSNPCAQRLLIRLPCVKCGRLRLLQQSDSHPRFCRTHLTVRKRVARITFNCVGYDDHGVTRHAHTCRRKARFTPGKIAAHTRVQKSRRSAQPFFLDKPTQAFRCRDCAAASRVVAMLDQQLYEHTKKRVRSPAGRVKAFQAEVVSEDLRPVPAWEDIRPGFAQSVRSEEGRSRRRPGRVMTPIDRRTTSKTIIVAKWSTGAPSSIAIGLCLLPDCRKIVLTERRSPARAASWHLHCHQEWSRTRGMRHWKSALLRGRRRAQPVPAAVPWRPVELQNLRRDFAWAIQHYLGDPERYSYRQIAERERLSFSTVRDAIKGVNERLPEPELVPRTFRHHIEFLLEAMAAQT